MGCEVHIDIFDDRLEITSPGGMFGRVNIQDQVIAHIKSDRRNPIIADLFHRMKYMERRGSGLMKIINETSKLPEYKDSLKPEFYSTLTSFTVIIKNVNYISDQDIAIKILEFCSSERTKKEICDYLGYNNLTYFTRKYLKPLVETGKLKLTIPDKPTSKNQNISKYKLSLQIYFCRLFVNTIYTLNFLQSYHS